MAQDSLLDENSRLAFTAEELTAYLDDVFPERHEMWPPTHIEELRFGSARLRMEYHSKISRPGGTISGPAMFKLCDYAIYVALLGVIGRVPLAVTTNLSINFLRRPAPVDLLADVRLLKTGKRLAVAEVFLYSDGSDDPVAHATGTYSIPQQEER